MGFYSHLPSPPFASLSALGLSGSLWVLTFWVFLSLSETFWVFLRLSSSLLLLYFCNFYLLRSKSTKK